MEIKILQSLSEVPPDAWKALQDPQFPFTHYEFLNALETTDCLGSRTGWYPAYLTCWQGARLQAALVLFLKTNSFGEYIFDFNWAHALESMGQPYYPKLTAAIPFTPATGSKFLFSSLLAPSECAVLREALIARALTLTEEVAASSLHFLFIPPEEQNLYRASGGFLRHSFQYHWRNEGYADFSQFLTRLRAKRRREILRERAQVLSAGIRFQWLTGQELEPLHAEIMYGFYLSTLQKREGSDYLTKDFFTKIFTHFADKILLVLAFNSKNEAVAGALNFLGSEALFGRYWGCLEEYKALHFEVCYYQGIEYCIQKKTRLFEAGAQGEHKFQRGFLPTLTYSAHFMENLQFAAVLEQYVEQEKQQIAQVFSDYAEHTPFSRAEEASSKN